MELIDTHCHLDFPQFDPDREEVMASAATAGVTEIIVPAVTAAGWPGLLELTASHSNLYPALGMHPCFMEQHREQHLSVLEMLLQQQEVFAVGEIGLDLYHQQQDLPQQLQLFIAQLVLAKKFNLPVLLHVRKAHDQVLKQLRKYALPRAGIVHAFSGSLQQAEVYLDMGYKLGIGGTISYPRATRLRAIVEALPLESFVLETDAPDMPLINYRGQINKPERLRQIADYLAEVKGCSLKQVAEVTTKTARQIYVPPP